MRNTALVALLATLLAACGQTPGTEPTPDSGTAVESQGKAQTTGTVVRTWLTTADARQRLGRQADLTLKAATTTSGSVTVDLDPGAAYQTIEGFGAALTQSSALLLSRLPAERRAEVLRRLFDARDGVGFSVVRLPMGASDFATSEYTYNDVPTGSQDPDLTGFSVARDEQDVLPVAREAIGINTSLRFFAAPWSAPAWMKTSGTLRGGQLRDDAYATYARYFARFVRAYGEAGVPISAVSIQNEPHHETGAYPSMRFDADDAARFIGDHLGPTLDGEGVDTRILGWDHNWDDTAHARTVLMDEEASAYVDGTAFHCYGGDVSAQSEVQALRPDAGVYFTECSGGGWATDFGANLRWNVEHLVIGATRHWARTVLLWNLALDPQGGPKGGGCQDCRGVVTIDPATGGVSYNVEYYALGHVSKFVTRGARRIGSTTGGHGAVQSVAFVNPDGSRAVVLLNGTGSSQKVRVRERDRAVVIPMPAGAVATVTWPGSN